jgi:hypothetical protein
MFLGQVRGKDAECVFGIMRAFWCWLHIMGVCSGGVRRWRSFDKASCE